MNVLSLFLVLLELFCFLFLGYLLAATRQLDQATNQKLSGLVANVLTPALILASVSAKDPAADGNIVAEALLAGCLLYAFYFILNAIVFRQGHPVEKMMIMFANTSFIGFPILRALYGDFAVFLFSIIHLPFNALIYTYGVSLIAKKKEKVSLRQLVSPGLISSLMAIVLFLSGMELPELVTDFLHTLGNASIPLSMIVIGVSLYFVSLQDLFKDKELWLITAFKLVGLPLITALIMPFLPFEEMIRQLLLISTVLPSGSMVVILANQYHSQITKASLGVFLTTLLSLITIPALLGILLK